MIDPTRDDRNLDSSRGSHFTFGRRDAPVFIRVGADGAVAGSNYFLDLADGSGRAVKLCARGWTVVRRPGLVFRRPTGHLPLPLPSHQGSIDLLRPYVNLTDRDFRRAIVWLASALLPCEPHPILMICGDDGSAKSTLAEVLKLLIDPHVRPLLSVPENAGELISTSVDRWVLAYDDVTATPGWFAKTLCDLARGQQIASCPAQPDRAPSPPLGGRPVIVSGIEDREEQVDLTQVSIGLHLQPILFDNRRAEGEFWRSFHADHSRILGGLLDLLAEGLCLAQAERQPA